MLIRQKVVGSMAVCCYVLGCEETKKGVIVDPGGDEAAILALCKEEGLTIEYIIATHGHPDHVCGNRKIKEATGARIVMHAADDAFFNKPEVHQYFSMLGLEHSPAADILVQDGDTITFGKQTLQVIHTPGHTPGGICLYSGSDLFSGDTLFVGAIGRTDFPGGDMGQFMDSIRQKILTLPDDTVIWPGHGYGGSQSTIGEEKRSNPFITGV
ncbi:MAG: MBL fold metallo-hydrolase [Desulfobulbaceae bacterium]|nr:MAG: MBL fold metallo-hydrolase [Desulfobulbaceae bacterium]